ncbi:diguanylate cyclase domain-containing protein [Pararhodobacter aggregans]|uniref:diguanylate cyclase domain-containing protein n=1 Tax=Pararhodobacter aggregans TaxID=404875 RepID=UPI003A8DEE60
MSDRMSDRLLQFAPFVTIGLVVVGLIANLAGGPRPGPALSLPTALAYALLAILWHQDLTRPTHRRHPRMTLILAPAIAALCLLTLADRWTGILDGTLDAAVRAAELGQFGLNGHVSSKSLLFIAACALALLGARRNRLLASLFVLALLAICNVAVVDLAMAGALWDRELSVWSTLAAFTLTLAATLRLRERSVFSPLFLPGPAGMALRLMAALSLVMPMLAGWIYAYLMAPKPQEADLIAQLFGGLGWVMFQANILLGFIIAREMHKVVWFRRHDGLTGFLNRPGLEAELKTLRTNVAGVMLCDIARFGTVTDDIGHLSAEALLRDVGRTISDTVTDEGALLCRIWADKFLIVVPNLAQPGLDHRAAALRAAVAALPSVQAPGTTYTPALNVGCATFIPGTMSLFNLLNDADSALHWTKSARRDGFGDADAADPLTDRGDEALASRAGAAPPRAAASGSGR